MSLRSALFRADTRLQSASTSDPSHVVPGDKGEHVRLIQRALGRLGYKTITGHEYTGATYGPFTAEAVLRYKTDRRIINTSYQSKPDNIVGKMTIQSLDGDMLRYESLPARG